MNKFVSRAVTLRILSNIQRSAIPFEYEPDKHRIIILDENKNHIFYFRLPIVLPSPDKLINQDAPQVNYIILLIQSGSCAIGYYENGKNLEHKVFRSYMVRMKQGVSQVKYLKTKGKSRAGSRVRLEETNEFFQNINQRLQKIFSEHQIHRIAISCSKILIPYLYNSKIATPFDKKDHRLFNIPKHIHLPIYEVLEDTNRFLLKGELIYEADYQAQIDNLLAEAGFEASANTDTN